MKTLLASQIQALINAVLATAGIVKSEPADSPFYGYGPLDMLRFFFTESGVSDAAHMSADRLGLLVIDTLRSPASASVSTNDLTQLLAGTVTRALLSGLDSAGTTYQYLSAPGAVPDLSRSTLCMNNETQDIQAVPEGQAPKQGNLADVGTPVSLTKWGQCILLTSEAIVRNSLDLFTVIPAGLGRAMSRKMNQQFWSLLLTGNGPVMLEDGLDLWNPNHANVQVGALTEANLGTALQALMAQRLRAPGDPVMDCLRPRTLVVGPRDYLNGCKLVGGAFLDTEWAPLRVVCEPLLPALTGANPWIVASDPAQLPGATVATLRNRREPAVSVQAGGPGGAKGITIDMSHFWQVLALDHRCFVKSVA